MFWHIFRCFQLQKMESDILPLQQANSELSEKSGMLQAEKKILEDEIKRWKARTQVSEEKHSPGIEPLFWQKYLLVHHHNFSLCFLAFSEPTKRFWSGGVQTTSRWTGCTCQTHSAAEWGEQQAKSRLCQVFFSPSSLFPLLYSFLHLIFNFSL